MTARFSVYLSLFRKHILLLVVAVAVVGASGFFYLWRQVPVFEAEALLLIEQPVPNLMGGASARNYFAISQGALNTELYLLRENKEMAETARATLVAEGIDPDEFGYTPDALTSSVTVSGVAGTEGLVRFALTGTHAETLPSAVNAYAQAYRRDAEKKRALSFELQQKDLEARLAQADDELTAAEKARDEFVEEHRRLNVARGENPEADRAAALANKLPELEDRAVTDRLEKRHIVDALDRISIRTEVDAESDVMLTEPGDGTSLHGALADSALVAGLPVIRQHPEINRLRGIETEARKYDRDLEEQGLLEGHRKRLAVASDLEAARERRGWITARAIERELSEIAARDSHLAHVREQLAEARAAADVCNEALAEYESLGRVVAATTRAFDEARGQLDRFTSTFLAREGETGDDENSARPPLRISLRIPARSARQIAPHVPLVVGLTLVAALVTGFGLVFVFEYVDDTIRSKEDFDRYIGLPFLGFIPRISTKDHENPDTAAESAPGSSIAEAFRSVRTSLLFAKGSERGRTLLVTSAGPGEGKTTIATNLATTFARKKGPVLLIDADLRKPRVCRALKLDAREGLSTILAGQGQLQDVVQESGVDGLFVLTSGPIPPNPAELLHGERLAEVLKEASEVYECVILDTPPLVAVSDARVLASRVDGLVLVISVQRTSRRLIQRAVESLTSIGFGVDGVVLNNVSSNEGRYGEYYSAKEYRRD